MIDHSNPFGPHLLCLLPACVPKGGPVFWPSLLELFYVMTHSNISYLCPIYFLQTVRELSKRSTELVIYRQQFYITLKMFEESNFLEDKDFSYQKKSLNIKDLLLTLYVP